MTNETAQVKLALAKSGYTVDFLSASYRNTVAADDVYVITYYNDEGETETGLVFVNRFTGKGEF